MEANKLRFQFNGFPKLISKGMLEEGRKPLKGISVVSVDSLGEV